VTDVLAVIPARSGSKGIRRKNVRDLDGKPLLAHQVENAVEADGVDRTIVSTDDEDFADVARKYGAEVPFTRPDDIATDDIPVIAVYEHAREYFAARNDEPTYLVGLQPTCPFTMPKQVELAVEKARRTACDSVVTVSKVTETHPYRSYTLSGDRLKPFEDVTVYEPLQRQDRPEAYGLTGAVFVRHNNVLRAWDGEDFALGEDTRAVVQTEAESVDIDTPFDLEVARALCAYDGEENKK
jgi:CMP-N-acetylneuraminic acid synthetase